MSNRRVGGRADDGFVKTLSLACLRLAFLGRRGRDVLPIGSASVDHPAGLGRGCENMA